MKKLKRKDARKNRIKFHQIFNDCTFTTDCLGLILANSGFSTEDLVSISHVSKAWLKLIESLWLKIKDVRIIFKSYRTDGYTRKYTTCIHKGYIQITEHPIDMYDCEKYCVSYWSRKIYINRERVTPLIYDNVYDNVYEKTLDIWKSP